MKKVFFSLLLFLLAYPFSTSAQDDNSLLWRISGNGMRQPSYLFGTIHLICPDDYIWTDKMQRSLDSSTEVCFELDLDDPSLLMQVAMGMTAESETKLSDFFTPEDYELLSSFLSDSMNINIALFQKMKPAALLSLFATNMLNCSTPISYENRIMEMADEANKEVIGLEDAREQIELINKLPDDSVVIDIMTTIKEYDKERDEYKDLMKAYKEQNLPVLQRLIEETAETGGDLTSFIDDRNKKWIIRMIEYMDQAPVFFAVGAGHLYGENGLVQLLKAEGFRVTPIK